MKRPERKPTKTPMPEGMRIRLFVYGIGFIIALIPFALFRTLTTPHAGFNQLIGFAIGVALFGIIVGFTEHTFTIAAQGETEHEKLQREFDKENRDEEEKKREAGKEKKTYPPKRPSETKAGSAEEQLS